MEEKPGQRPPEANGAAPTPGGGRRRAGLWIALSAASVLALLAGLVTFAPTQVARWIADRYFAGLGIDVSGVKTLDVDVLRGEVKFGPVSFRATPAEPGRVGRLGLDLSVRKLFARQVLVRSLIIEGIDLRITQSADGAFAMNGVPLGEWLRTRQQPARAWNVGAWGGGVDALDLRNARVLFITSQGGEASLTIDLLEVREVQTLRPDQPGTFAFWGNVNGVALSARGRAWPFADPARAEGEVAINDVGLEKIEHLTGPMSFDKRAGRLDVASSLRATLDPERRLQLGGKGVVRLADLDVARADLGRIKMVKAEAPFEADFTLGPGGALAATGTLGISVEEGALSIEGGPDIALPSLSLQPGKITLARAGNGTITLEAKPHLKVRKPSLMSRDLRFAATDAGIDSDNISFANTDSGSRVSGRVGLGLSDAEATWREQASGARLAKGSVGRFRVDFSDITMDAANGRITLDAKGNAAVVDAALTSSVLKPYLGEWLKIGETQTTLKKVSLTAAEQTRWTADFDATVRRFGSGAIKGAPQLRTAAVYLKAAQIDDGGHIGADAIVLDRPEADITTDWIRSLTAGGRLEKDLERVADEVSMFRLQQFSVLETWRIGLSDYMVKPPAYFTLKLNTVDLFDLDTGKPRQQSKVAVRGTLNEFTQLQSGGWASPFAPKPSFDVFATIRRLQLPALSPYAARAVGATIESGSLRADAAAKADAGRLRGVLDLTIGDLSIATGNAAPGGGGGVVGVPIETVIGLLQDNDGRIRLNVPFAGDLTAPAFDFSNAFGKALTGALQVAVTAPFRLAYLPVDLISRLGQSGAPELRPVPFAAGETSLSIEGNQLIEALALILTQRPSLRIRVCGRATRSDDQALRAREGLSPGQALPTEDQRQRLEGELGALAYERTLAVRSTLIREHGVSGRQVQECRARYDAGDDGPPRAEIEL